MKKLGVERVRVGVSPSSSFEPLFSNFVKLNSDIEKTNADSGKRRLTRARGEKKRKKAQKRWRRLVCISCTFQPPLFIWMPAACSISFLFFNYTEDWAGGGEMGSNGSKRFWLNSEKLRGKKDIDAEGERCEFGCVFPKETGGFGYR